MLATVEYDHGSRYFWEITSAQVLLSLFDTMLSVSEGEQHWSHNLRMRCLSNRVLSEGEVSHHTDGYKIQRFSILEHQEARTGVLSKNIRSG